MTDQISSNSHAPKGRRRKIVRVVFVISLGAVLIGLGFCYRYFWSPPPEGNGPAGPPVARDAFAKPWTTRPVVLLGLGDSITAGFGATKGNSYFDRLTRNPSDEFAEMKGICLSTVLPALSTRNLAVSGSTSLDLEKTIDKLQPYPTDTIGIVVMTTGGNDVLHDYGRGTPREGAMYGATLEQAQPWIRNYDTRLNKILDRLDQIFPAGCHVFIGNIYDPTDGVGDIENAPISLPEWKDARPIHGAYNDVIARVATSRKNVHLIDIHAAFLGHGFHCAQFWNQHYRRDDPHYWYFYNLEDPNDRGYDALRRLFLIEMAKALPADLSDAKE